MRRLFALALVLGFACSGFAAAAQDSSVQLEIEWEVENRYRLFDGAEEGSREGVARLMKTIADSGDSSLFDHFDGIVATLGGRDAESLRVAQFKRGDLDGKGGSGRYARNYLYPSIYSIRARLPADAYRGRHCRWFTLAGEAPGRCDVPTSVPLIGGEDLSKAGWSAKVSLSVSIDGAAPVTKEIDFADRLIVALGDSYISGEGIPDVPSRITTEPKPVFERASWGAHLKPEDYERAIWWDEPCHRSLLSWPVLSSLAYSARNKNEAVTLVHLGCSGAEIDDIIKRGQKDMTGGGDEPKAEHQLNQLERLMAPPDAGGWTRRKIDRVLLSIGGNDSGFGGVLVTTFLPSEGYTLPAVAPTLIGNGGGGICPYRDTGRPLGYLCFLSRSAEKRLGKLKNGYDALDRALKAKEFAPKRVVQFHYPNPLLEKGGEVCRTPLSDFRIERLRREAERARDPATREWLKKVERQAIEYRDWHGPPSNDPYRGYYFSGFEGAMGVIPGFLRGWRFRTWDLRIDYRPEKSIEDGLILPEPIECDLKPEVGDTEVCQALWVHHRLTEEVQKNSEGRSWKVVGAHTAKINGHGICRETPTARLRLPWAENGHWLGEWTPQSYKPYAPDLPRWFRTTNDSLVTQYGGPDEFKHGSMHPTLQAHIAYADAALREALGDLKGP